MRAFAIVFSALAAVGSAIGCGFVYWYEYGGNAWALCLSVIAALPVASILHELGHVLIGLCAKIKASPDFKIFGSSSCRIVPKTDKDLKPRIVAAAAGGLAVNLAFVALGIVALTVPAVPSYLAVLLPASAYLLILNGFPVYYAGGKTDGLVIAEILRGEDEAKVTLAVLKVQAQLLGGKQIAEVDESLLFDLPQIREDEQAFIALTELRYEYFKAKGDGEKAEAYKKRFEELKEEYL